VEASDILKQALYPDLDSALEFFTSVAQPYLQIDTESEGRDMLKAERKIQFEYIKFLQQEIIEKLIQNLLQTKSENILLQKKNQSINTRLVTIKSQHE
jgi:hypothetical protein